MSRFENYGRTSRERGRDQAPASQIRKAAGRCALVAVVALLACPAGALSAGPAWRVDSLSDTTAAPGGTLRYLLQVTNTGDAPTDGTPYSLVATLPAPLTALSATGGGLACQGDGPGAAPNIVGASTIACTGGGTLQRHRSQQPTITVAIPFSAPPLVTASFELSGGGGADASTSDPTKIQPSPDPFGVDAFDGQVTGDATGAAYTQAGGHPYAALASIDFDTLQNTTLDLLSPGSGVAWPVEPAKDAFVDLPPGLIGNPTVAAKCTPAELANAHGPQPLPLCPPDAQVGTTLVRINGVGSANVRGPVPVFNMVAPPDVPARFGFNVLGTVVTLDAQLRSGSDYGLSVNARNISEGLAIAGTSLTFWGVPSDPSHDSERACPGVLNPVDGGPTCTSGAPRKAFLRNPTTCTADAGGPVDGLATSVHVDSWLNPGHLSPDGLADTSDPNWKSASFVSHLPPAYPAPPTGWGPHQLPTGCANVPFSPTLSAKPELPAVAGEPNGLTFDLKLPQNDDPNSLGEGDLKSAVVKLPVGVRVSPSSATGLQGCAPGEIMLHSIADPTCPDGSKIGTLTLSTPLLDQLLTGSIYLASPHDNPFGSLIAIYLVAKGPGLILKLPGRVDTDPTTGQLTATFDNQPQAPFTSLHLDFDHGPRAPLVLPSACGAYATHAVLTSWSGKVVTSETPFIVDRGCGPRGFAPTLTAGTQNPVAGADTPFSLRLTRGDQDQELSGLTVDMPTGLLGRIANTVLCPDGAANAGTCDRASLIGGVTVGAGAGTNPFYIATGRAYITGPYRGAPYGLSIVVPAVAGPFDLGNVVVRAAIFVDRTTAALKVVSDPLPTILQGIPLEVRDVRVAIDKPRFIVNPTSCAVKQVLGTIASTEGAIAHGGSRFQVGECASLPLAPKLSLTVGSRRHTHAGVSTPLIATLTQTAGQTNLRSVSVALPGTLNALLPVVNRACDRSAFNAGHCTNATRIGSAVAVTPLLRDPLRGSAYFVKTSSGHLPNLMVALRGPIAIDLTGKVSIPGGKRLATTFNTIPDAPITRFSLRIVSGTNGPVGIATNLCSAKGRSTPASLGFRGQNGKLLQVSQRLHIVGCPKAARARRARRR